MSSDDKPELVGQVFRRVATRYDVMNDVMSLGTHRLLKRADWSDRGNATLEMDVPSFTFGGNTISFETGTAVCRQGEINLTDQEIRLLKLFITHRGKPLSRSRLLEVGWGYTRGVSSRTVDNFVVRLRKYFEEDLSLPTCCSLP